MMKLPSQIRANLTTTRVANSHRVGESVMFQLRAAGVDCVFGMPGTHSLELYRAIESSGMRHVCVRHEQGAAFIADGYARSSGRPGVCIIIGGPGVTNAATAIGEAYADSVPILVISNAIDTANLGMGRNMVHEISDQRGLTAPITAMSVLATSSEQVRAAIEQSFSLFKCTRPRPIHISIPIDVLKMQAAEPRESHWPEAPVASPESLSRAAEIIGAAKRPILLVGGGAANAATEILALVETMRVPVISTTAGKGILPEDHPLSLGSALLSKRVLRALCDSDAVIAIGTEIGEADLFETAEMEADGSPDAIRIEHGILPFTGKLVRFDIDARAIADGRYVVHAPIVGDARGSLREFLERHCPKVSASTWTPDQVREIRGEARRNLSPLQRKHVAVLDEIRRVLPRDAFMVGDLAQINTTSQSHFPTYVPRSLLMPLGFSTLGYGLPAAIGAKLANPDRAGIAVVGDGGVMFTIAELATAVELRLRLPILLWNNNSLGEIRDYMDAREIPRTGVSPHNPNFVDLARAFGAHGVRPASISDIGVAVTEALNRDQPTLIEIDEEAPYLENL